MKDLVGPIYGNEFCDGVWMHCFLNTFDYHGQHVSVSRMVIHAEVIKKAACLEVVVKNTSKRDTTT